MFVWVRWSSNRRCCPGSPSPPDPPDPPTPPTPGEGRGAPRKLLRPQLIQAQARQRRQLVEHSRHRASRLEFHVLLDRLLGDLAGELLPSVAQRAGDGM